MGVDFSQQEVIKKKNNILLEEMSGFYYLKAVWHLLSEKQEGNFIAATGNGKLEVMANMFLGWGLEFIVVMDDDGSGRSIYNAMKKSIYGDDDEHAKRGMYKIKSHSGIEDIFDKADFAKYVLETDTSHSEDNSKYVRTTGHSKVVLA